MWMRVWCSKLDWSKRMGYMNVRPAATGGHMSVIWILTKMRGFRAARSAKVWSRMAGRGKCPVLSVKERVLRIRSRLRVFLMKVGNQAVMHMAIVSAPKTDQNRSVQTNNTETGDFPGKSAWNYRGGLFLSQNRLVSCWSCFPPSLGMQKNDLI